MTAKIGWMGERAVADAGLSDYLAAVHGDLFATAKADALLAEGAWVYVGDHPGDVAAAQAANAIAVAVATGAHDESALRAAGADVVLTSLNDFAAWYNQARN